MSEPPPTPLDPADLELLAKGLDPDPLHVPGFGIAIETEPPTEAQLEAASDRLSTLIADLWRRGCLPHDDRADRDEEWRQCVIVRPCPDPPEMIE